MSNAIIPLEGIHHMFGVTVLGHPQVTSWYIAPFGNGYTPQPGDTMATFPTLAGELSMYQGATRLILQAGTPSGGVISNANNVAEFTFTEPCTVHGFFLCSTGTKGAASGVLLAARHLPSPRVIPSAGDKLLVTAGLQIISN